VRRERARNFRRRSSQEDSCVCCKREPPEKGKKKKGFLEKDIIEGKRSLRPREFRFRC